jgi:hypothetical protein
VVGIRVKVAPEGEGGYILLEVEERDMYRAMPACSCPAVL